MNAGDAGDAADEADHRLLRRALGLEVPGHLELLEHPPLDAVLLATQISRLACPERRAVRVHLVAFPLLLAAAQLLGGLAGQLDPAATVELL